MDLCALHRRFKIPYHSQTIPRVILGNMAYFQRNSCTLLCQWSPILEWNNFMRISEPAEKYVQIHFPIRSYLYEFGGFILSIPILFTVRAKKC